MRGLLDTHMLLYWIDAQSRLAAAQTTFMEQVSPENPLWVAEISLWEIATLCTLGRINLYMPLRD